MNLDDLEGELARLAEEHRREMRAVWLWLYTLTLVGALLALGA